MSIKKSYKQTIQDLQVYYRKAYSPDGTPIEKLAQLRKKILIYFSVSYKPHEKLEQNLMK